MHAHTTNRPPQMQVPSFLALVAVAALCLGAFWLLLRGNYSPETYTAHRAVPDTLELAWFVAALAVTVVSVAWLRRQPGPWRAILPVVSLRRRL